MRSELLALFGRPLSPELDTAQLPGFLREYLALVTANTDARSGLLLTAWLPFCAVNLGNRVYMVNNSTRVYPNVWSCVIGPSSISRKTTALRFAGYTIKPHEEALQTAAVEAYEQQTLLLTGATLSKMMSMLAQNPSRLFVHNELAAWLHDMNRSYNAGYKQVVTELYDGVDRTIANRERTERIIRPALSIAAASTEGWLYKNMMDGAEQLGGFLQRMLFYVVRNVNLDEVDLCTHSGNNLENDLAAWDENYFHWWRLIPGPCELELAPEATALRDELYTARYKQYFATANDVLMSYFTRIYDGYWFKFCILITLSGYPRELASCVRNGLVSGFFANNRVDALVAAQAFYLCDFYMANTLPLLAIMDEQDKLAGERKLVELLIHKFGGKARHSALMNISHMRKREFKECLESLIEREAISVEATQSGNFKTTKQYSIAPELLEAWHDKGK